MSNQSLIIIACVILIIALIITFLYLKSSQPVTIGSSDNLLNKNINKNSLIDEKIRRKDGRIKELIKELKYAKWGINPTIFYLCAAAASIICFLVISKLFVPILAVILSIIFGPLLMNTILYKKVTKRARKFEKDYPPMLLSMVSFLKTGMNTMTALKTSAEGLEDGSLVKEEIELLLERLRFGVSEDISLGAFGEDIKHPEIELFVQALLLSSKVGGTLSDTLDRLSKQVRKRQYFTESAKSAVSMQKGSVWFILIIMVGMIGYLYAFFPEVIIDAWENETTKLIWQVCIILILIGFYWISRVTRIKI